MLRTCSGKGTAREMHGDRTEVHGKRMEATRKRRESARGPLGGVAATTFEALARIFWTQTAHRVCLVVAMTGFRNSSIIHICAQVGFPPVHR